MPSLSFVSGQRTDKSFNVGLGLLILFAVAEIFAAGFHYMNKMRPTQTAVVAPHAAVGTVFAAKIGDLDYRADKHLVPERFDGDARSAFVKGMLSSVAGFQDVGRWEKRLVNHRLS